VQKRGNLKIKLRHFLLHFACLNQTSNLTAKNSYLANRINGVVGVLSDGVKSQKMAENRILSPVRLPFRHTGNRLLPIV
jgi:hypothetical protein